MLTTIKGTYQNGRVILRETPPVQEPAEVVVTFLEPETPAQPHITGSPVQQGVRFGSLAGKVGVPDDFNEPLNDLSDYM